MGLRGPGGNILPLSSELIGPNPLLPPLGVHPSRPFGCKLRGGATAVIAGKGEGSRESRLRCLFKARVKGPLSDIQASSSCNLFVVLMQRNPSKQVRRLAARAFQSRSPQSHEGVAVRSPDLIMQLLAADVLKYVREA